MSTLPGPDALERRAQLLDDHDGDGDGNCNVDGEGKGDGDSRAIAVFDGRGGPLLSLSASASWMSEAPANPGCPRAPL